MKQANFSRKNKVGTVAKKVFTQKVDSKELQVNSKRTFTFLKKGKGANCSTFKLGKAQLSEKGRESLLAGMFGPKGRKNLMGGQELLQDQSILEKVRFEGPKQEAANTAEGCKEKLQAATNFSRSKQEAFLEEGTCSEKGRDRRESLQEARNSSRPGRACGDSEHTADTQPLARQGAAEAPKVISEPALVKGGRKESNFERSFTKIPIIVVTSVESGLILGGTRNRTAAKHNSRKPSSLQKAVIVKNLTRQMEEGTRYQLFEKYLEEIFSSLEERENEGIAFARIESTAHGGCSSIDVPSCVKSNASTDSANKTLSDQVESSKCDDSLQCAIPFQVESTLRDDSLSSAMPWQVESAMHDDSLQCAKNLQVESTLRDNSLSGVTTLQVQSADCVDSLRNSTSFQVESAKRPGSLKRRRTFKVESAGLVDSARSSEPSHAEPIVPAHSTSSSANLQADTLIQSSRCAIFAPKDQQTKDKNWSADIPELLSPTENYAFDSPIIEQSGLEITLRILGGIAVVVLFFLTS